EVDGRRRAGGLGEVHLAALGPLARGPQQQNRVVLVVALGEAGAHLPLAEPLVVLPRHAAGGALAVASDRHDPVLHGDGVGRTLAFAAVAFAVVGTPLRAERRAVELVGGRERPPAGDGGLCAVARRRGPPRHAPRRGRPGSGLLRC